MSRNSQGAALALRLALRELRGGLSGFYIFLACIALGAAAIAGVNSISASISSGIETQGKSILGGDVAVSLVQQQPPGDAQKFLEEAGDVSRTVTLRAMARRSDGQDQTLIELKAADESYPLYGELLIDNGAEQAPVNWADTATDTIFVDQLLLDRLALKIGDRLEIGEGSYLIGGAITSEPDRLSDGLIFGPRVLMPIAGMAKANLLRAGSLFRENRAVRLKVDDDGAVKRFAERANTEFAKTGWRVRSRDNAAPALSRNIERFSQFLTLVGLTALIVGGVGVANSVRAFMERKRPVIATLKSLGASGDLIFTTYLMQIMLLASAGIAAGLVIGALMPFVAKWALAGILPVSSDVPFHIKALALGTVYGLLTAIVFAVWPLGIARETQAASLFRSAGYAMNSIPRLVYVVIAASGVIAIAVIAVLTSTNKMIALVFLGAIGASFILLRLVALIVQWIARNLPSPRSTPMRLAVGNLYRPGSLTPSVTLSLGLGLSLIVALSLIDTSLRKQVSENLPQRAPDFFFIDIQNTEFERFNNVLQEIAPGAQIEGVPMMRGRVTRLKGIESEKYPVGEGGGWVLRGDRGITFSATLPENASLADGKWWEADYQGEALVSFSAEEATELDLEVGDEISVNVLGREITARIANLRNVEWESLAINFVMVFSPNSFVGAPYGYLATLSGEGGDGQAIDTASGARIMKTVTQEFPSVVTVSVRDALETVNRLIGQLGNAIRAASVVALATAMLVLAGALAAGNQARTSDSVVLKTLGATRRTLITAFVAEYAMLGFATALFALLAGGLAAWFVLTNVMEMEFVLSAMIPLLVIVLSLTVTIGLGLASTWRILGQKSAPYLREL
ncbi:MAG: FtsX-like permease family protein [Rhizobiaceae bacterium]